MSSAAPSRGSLGLPSGTNHLAFRAADLDEWRATRERWRAAGFDVVQVDDGW